MKLKSMNKVSSFYLLYLFGAFTAFSGPSGLETGCDSWAHFGLLNSNAVPIGFLRGLESFQAAPVALKVGGLAPVAHLIWLDA